MLSKTVLAFLVVFTAVSTSRFGEANASLDANIDAPLASSPEFIVTGESGDDAPSTGIVPILWRDPKDISSRDLHYGSGGRERAPRAPYTFVKELTGGTTPKFLVRDGRGVEWRVKIGNEAQPETAATRFVWAAGYYTDDDYIVPVLRVNGMQTLSRGSRLIEPDGSMRFARFERNPEGLEYAGKWKWRKNPFSNTRELNGLKVMMALMNSWDMKDSNNSVYTVTGDSNTRVYLVGDLGETFGRNKYVMGGNRPGSPKHFAKTSLTGDVDADDVSFRAPGRAPYLHFWVVPHTFYNLWSTRARRVTRDVPREDVRWMGEILSKLSERQIRSAFEGAGYGPDDAASFTESMRIRIAQLRDI